MLAVFVSPSSQCSLLFQYKVAKYHVDKMFFLLVAIAFFIPHVSAKCIRPAVNRRLYWLMNFPSQLVRSDLDGGSVEIIVGGLKHPDAFAIDEVRGKIFWSDSGHDPAGLFRSNLDGSSVEFLSPDVTSLGMAVDENAEKLYWTDWELGKIRRSNLDGSEMEDVIDADDAYGIAIDVVLGTLYWSEITEARIQSTQIENPGQVELVVGNLSHPQGIAIDQKRRRLLWVDTGTFKIQSVSLETGSIVDVVPEVNSPTDVAVDVDGGWLYWTLTGVQVSVDVPRLPPTADSRIQKMPVDHTENPAKYIETIRAFGRQNLIGIAVIGARDEHKCENVGSRHLRPGDWVMLTEESADIDKDATKGPLKKGMVGRIVVDDNSETQFMVSVDGKEWWYKKKALQFYSPG